MIEVLVQLTPLLITFIICLTVIVGLLVIRFKLVGASKEFQQLTEKQVIALAEQNNKVSDLVGSFDSRIKDIENNLVSQQMNPVNGILKNVRPPR